MSKPFRSRTLFFIIILCAVISNHHAGAVESSPTSYTEARYLFHKARAVNPSHPAVEANQFYRYARQLEQAKKIKEATLLGEIATELYPKAARLYADFADLFLQTGQRDKAIKFLRKALEIDPEFEPAKTKLEKLRKDKEKEK